MSRTDRSFVTYCLTWLAAFFGVELLIRFAAQGAAGTRFLAFGLLFMLLMVGGFPFLFAPAHIGLLRSLERRGRSDRPRLVLASFGLGAVLGLIPPVLMFAVSRSLARPETIPSFLIASLAGGYAVARSWPRHGEDPAAEGGYGPIFGALIGGAAGWVLVYWGMLVFEGLTGQMGNLSGLAEMFYAAPAAAAGAVIGLLLTLTRSRTQTRRPLPAILIVSGGIALLGLFYVGMLRPGASGRSYQRERSLDVKQEEAAQRLVRLGGGVRVDSTRPDKPVVAVNLSQDPVTDSDMAALAAFPQLRELNLNMTRITDAGLVHLQGLTELREVHLAAVRVRGPGLAHLSGMKRLRMLSLGSSLVRDGGLAHLAGLSGLKELYLFQTGVTDAGIAYLAGLTDLQKLDLNKTGVTDAGLPHLYRMDHLQELRLRDTRVTDAGVAALQQKLPDMRIVGRPRIATSPVR
jgi:Leucine Rich Repeat (LRR) protein